MEKAMKKFKDLELEEQLELCRAVSNVSPSTSTPSPLDPVKLCPRLAVKMRKEFAEIADWTRARLKHSER